MRPRFGPDELSQLAAGNLSDIKQRSERPWREQRIAGTPQHSHRATAGIAERPHQRRLADTGLARDENEGSRASERLRQRLV